MKKPLLIALIALGSISLIASTNVLTAKITKKKYLPKATKGDIYVDYTENPKQPAMYLYGLDPDVINGSDEVITLGIVRVRK